MEYYSSHINKLIEQFSHLPGIGAKSAQRLAFHIMNMPRNKVQQLTNAITDARMNVQYCKCCYTLTDKEMCPICSNPKRDHSTIMVVENTRDLAAYEKPVNLMEFIMYFTAQYPLCWELVRMISS